MSFAESAHAEREDPPGSTTKPLGITWTHDTGRGGTGGWQVSSVLPESLASDQQVQVGWVAKTWTPRKQPAMENPTPELNAASEIVFQVLHRFRDVHKCSEQLVGSGCLSKDSTAEVRVRVNGASEFMHFRREIIAPSQI